MTEKKVDRCTIGAVALFQIILIFLVGPHNAVSYGIIENLFLLMVIATILIYILECIKKCRDNKPLVRQIRYFLFMLVPVAGLMFVINLQYGIFLSALWLVGLVVLLIIKWVSPIGRIYKVIDGIFNSGIPLG